MKYEWRCSSDRAIVPQSASRQRGSCREQSLSRPAATAVAVGPIVIAPIVVVPVVGAPVVDAFFFGWWTPEPHFAFCCFPKAMVKGSKWTTGEELSISDAFIAMSEGVSSNGTNRPTQRPRVRNVWPCYWLSNRKAKSRRVISQIWARARLSPGYQTSASVWWPAGPPRRRIC